MSWNSCYPLSSSSRSSVTLTYLEQLEQEHEWLSQKLEKDENLIKRAEAYFDDHQLHWSREIFEGFMNMLEKMKDQLNFEQSRLEKLTWQIIMERDANG